MRIIVNGQEQDVSATTLDVMLIELGFVQDWLATAVNGALVPAEERKSFTLEAGARIEVLSPMQGG